MEPSRSPIAPNPTTASPVSVPTLRDPMLESLRATLHESVEERASVADVRLAAREAADAARARGLRVEDLILRCKALCVSMPDVQRDGVARAREIRELVVTLCIVEYYGEADPH